MLKNTASRGGWLGESPVLAQRAASEGPRWTHAVGDSSGSSIIDTGKRASLEELSSVARCGLAWAKARLGAPGLGGLRRTGFLSILYYLSIGST